MKLTHEQIKAVTLGASYIEHVDGKTIFHRFTAEQEALYRTVSDNFYNKTLANSCIRLEFETDSSYIFIKTKIKPRSSRTFYSHDIFVDGELWEILDGKVYAESENIVSKNFVIGKKGIKKNVRIHLPWSCSSDIIEISVDDDSAVIPTKKSLKMICFGDSITQGYDATYTSNSYASKIAVNFDAEIRNKGIGGEIFRPELASLKDNIDPEYITVAYGTNDWCAFTYDEFTTRCRAFYENLSKNYPNAKIFAFTPIWRKQIANPAKAGEFCVIGDFIKAVAATLPNVTVIDCLEFVPADLTCFSPDGVHPNDKGFDFYANGVIEKIKSLID